MRHAFLLGEEAHDIGLSRSREGYRLHIDGQELSIKLLPGEAGDWVLHSGHAVDHLAIATTGDDTYIHLDGETYHLRFEHALQRLAQMAEGSTADSIKATMPGSLISLAVSTGQHVSKGETLLVMESMKMETTIVAPRDGVIAEVAVAPGQTFDKDAVLVTLEPEAVVE